MNNVIHISGLEVFAHHGVFDHERRDGQLFVIDLDVFLDTSAASESDDLSDTLDYGALAHAVHDAVAKEPLNLLEALAMRVLRTVFSFPQAEAASVTIHKPEAPMPVVTAGVSLTVSRERHQVL
jgi:7,8-dihydroneopterin aldolase/epimerase/oxygenase